MKESKFIEQNKEKWEKLEKMIQAENNDPNVLSDLFIQLTDDLSYSRTFYKNRTVRAYLNNLTRIIFEKIYINKKAKGSHMLHFWRFELPSIIYQSRKELLTSLLIFIISMLIGVFSSIVDPDFSKMILGSQYVEMTMENIESGDPMAVYKKMNQVDMFLGITWNNILVAFKTFIFGIFLGLGTLFILIYNGVMVGTFQYFFIEKNLFAESFLTIWIHGTLEISSIVIAGGAGLVFGKGLLFPGTLTRLQSFRESSVRALKIFIGIVPVFILAGLLESFVTRYTDVNILFRIAIILFSAGFIVFYFIVLPFRIKNPVSYSDLPENSVEKKFTGEKMLSGEIKNTSEILNLSFNLYHSKLRKFLPVVFLLSLSNIPLFWFYVYPNTDSMFSGNFLAPLSLLFQYATHPFLLLTNSGCISLIFLVFARMVMGESDRLFFNKRLFVKFLKLFMIVLAINSIFLIELPVIAILLVFLVLPYGLNWAFVSYKSNNHFFRAFSHSYKLLQNNGGRLWGSYTSTLVLAVILFLFFNSPILMASAKILEWNLPYDPENTAFIFSIFKFWFVSFLIYMLLPIIYVAIAINFYSLEEIFYALGLKLKVNNFLKN